MKVNGAYKFRTKAIKDNFRACFLVLKFLNGSTQISKDEFAQAVSGGVWTTFNQITGEYRPGSFFDFSVSVEVSIFISNTKGDVTLIRKIDNLLEYSLFHLPGNIPNYTHFLIPDIKVVIDVNEDGGTDVYGLISPGGSFFSGVNRRESPRGVAIPLDDSPSDSIRQTNIYSFKNSDSIIEIDTTSRLQSFEGDGYTGTFGFTSGSIFFSISGVASYLGYGLWANEIFTQNILFQDASYTTGFSDCSFVHQYPDTVILPTSGLPANANVLGNTGISLSASYNIDFGASYSTSYLADPVLRGNQDSVQLYSPTIKDSKTGNLIFVEYHRPNVTQPSILEPKWKLHSGNRAITDYFYNYDGSDYRPLDFDNLNKFKAGMFLYDDNLISLNCKQTRGGEMTVTVKGNQDFPLLTENRDTFESTLNVKLPKEFKEAIEENELGEQINIPQKKEVYSETTKNYWRFCNAVVLNG
jgi:hypothetical protein